MCIRDSYYPVDAEGNVIEVEEYEPDAPILLLTGDGAPHHLAELLKVLATDEELANRVKAAVFVSNRRWDLIFDNVNNLSLIHIYAINYGVRRRGISTAAY